MTHLPLRSSIVRNVLSNWGITALAIVYTLIITPIVIGALGNEMYGVWSFLNGLLAYSDLLYLGVGAALIKHIARHTVAGDQVAVNRLASGVLSILTGIGLLCFLAMASLAPVIPSLLATPLSTEAARVATYACLLLGFQLLCFFSASTYIAILVGHDRFDLVNLAKLGTIGIRFLLVGAAVQTSNPFLGLAVFLTIAVALDLAVLRYLAHRVSPRLRLTPVRPSPEELRQIYGFGLQSFLIQLSFKLISYTDVTVIAMSLGAASVSLYVLPLQLIEYLRVALGGISGVLLPRLTGMATRGEHKALAAAYRQSTRLVALVAAFIATHMMWLGVPFLSIWVGPEFGEPARWVIVCLAGATFLHIFSSIVALPFYQAIGIMAVPATVLIVEAAINLVLSIILVRVLGIDGVALATVMPALLVSFLVLPRYLCSKLKVSFTAVIAQSIAPAAGVALVVAGVHWLVAPFLPATSYLTIVLRVLVTVPVAAAVIIPSLTTSERQWLAERLSRRRA